MRAAARAGRRRSWEALRLAGRAHWRPRIAARAAAYPPSWRGPVRTVMDGAKARRAAAPSAAPKAATARRVLFGQSRRDPPAPVRWAAGGRPAPGEPDRSPGGTGVAANIADP